MFKKKPNIKPLAPLRSSDRRRVADQIIADLGLTVPDLDSDDTEAKAAATAKHTDLRQSLLPDNVLSAKFATTAGPELRQVSGTLYVGNRPGEEQRVLWVKTEERMYPSVYTLWSSPHILPLLHTPAAVVKKLQGGADLMTPGLAGGPPFPAKATRSALVAVASLEAPTVPVVVGSCEIDVSGLQRVEGVKGRAVQTLHWAGDEVWSWSAAGRPGAAVPQQLDGWSAAPDEDGALATQTDGLRLQSNEEQSDTPELHDDAEGPANTAESQADISQHSGTDEHELSMKDEIYENAFLYGVSQQLKSNATGPHHGLDFPLSQSFVMSKFVQPFFPELSPLQAASLQLKRSSWKNSKKFITQLGKRGVAMTKNKDGNEVMIWEINFQHRLIEGFVPYDLPVKETSASASAGRAEKGPAASDPGDVSVGQRLEVKLLYRPKEKLGPIFAAAGQSGRGYLTAAEVRQAASAYVDDEKLASTTNKRLITLNPTLANTVFDGSVATDREALGKGTALRDTVGDRVLASCSPFWVILRNGESWEDATTKPKAGAPPLVRIVLETRTGNKTVTKISGLEAFAVPTEPLADELRKACASSTSVERLVGSSAKSAVMEVMVQGPQQEIVKRALERRGVKKQWIDVVDKTKGRKKG